MFQTTKQKHKNTPFFTVKVPSLTLPPAESAKPTQNTPRQRPPAKPQRLGARHMPIMVIKMADIMV